MIRALSQDYSRSLRWPATQIKQHFPPKARNGTAEDVRIVVELRRRSDWLTVRR